MSKREMRIVAEKTEVKNLKPGDLFSDKGPEYWKSMEKMSVAPALIQINSDYDDPDEIVYKLTIVRTSDGIEDSNKHIRRHTVSPFTPPGLAHEEWNKK